jgi:formylglycine-generating enzyme required for sulfatase activity
MPRLMRLVLVAVIGFVPPSPAGDEKGKGKEKEDALVAAMKFVKVPKGTFWRGWDGRMKQSKQVEIKQDFEVAAFTVTQAQWQEVMGGNPSFFSRKGGGKDKVKDVKDADLARFPVENVSWDDVQEFLKKLNAGQKGKGWLYRLPTGAESEYACRGAATSKKDCSFDYYFDKPTNDLSSEQANFDGNFPAGKAAKGGSLGRPAPVGSYKPNKLGLYDMHGNVWQWCSDYLDERIKFRVDRGGSWRTRAFYCRAASNEGGDSTARGSDVGFRLVRVPADKK